MKLYRYCLKPLSPWGTPLRSDTLYGLILWRIAESEGQDACTKSIEAFSANEPPFLVSSAMPFGCLPMPCLPPVPRRDFRGIAEKYFALDDSDKKDMEGAVFRGLQEFKKFRKKAWLPLPAWQACAANLGMGQLFEHYLQNRDQAVPDFGEEGFEAHVSINRQTQTAQKGALFFSRLRYFAKDTKLHLYARTADPEKLCAWLETIGELGFGKDASTGNGRFEVELDDKLENLGELAESGSKLLLSSLAAPNMQGLHGWYKCESRSCKAGPGMGSPFKAPFLSLNEGAILRSLPEGPFVLSIHVNPAVVQIFAPLTLPCKVAEMQEAA